jgi:aryl-alcohol dehydrogenase-like predicted oxidoreductase
MSVDVAQAPDRALVWLVQRSPNILLIPAVEHLRENLKAATLQLPAKNDRRSRLSRRRS